MTQATASPGTIQGAATHARDAERRAIRFGFTGSRYTDPTHQPLIEEVLHAHLDGSSYTTGGQVGIDTYVLRRMVLLVPEAHHRVCIPESGPGWDNPYLDLATEVERVPDGEHKYRARNERILDHSDCLLAFPLHPEAHTQSRRSGTWMTVHLARSRGIPVKIYVLDR